MLNLKEFENAVQSVTQEELFKKKARGQYMPYVELLLKKARVIPIGRSAEVDVKDPKIASQLATATRNYLKKTKADEQYAVGWVKTFVYCGRRNGKVK